MLAHQYLVKPYQPIPRIVTSDGTHDLIRRVLSSNLPIGTSRVDLITTTKLRVSLIDSGSDSMPRPAEGDTCLHILWQLHEKDAALTVEGDLSPISPGDTASIPAGDRWLLSSDQLAVEIVNRQHHLALSIPPSHGSERFVGFNRETVYQLWQGISLVRWKLTSPLTLPAIDKEIVLIDLFSPIALQFRVGIDLLQQGEARVIRSEVGPITLVPNGLAYVLVLVLV